MAAPSPDCREWNLKVCIDILGCVVGALLIGPKIPVVGERAAIRFLGRPGVQKLLVAVYKKTVDMQVIIAFVSEIRDFGMADFTRIFVGDNSWAEAKFSAEVAACVASFFLAPEAKLPAVAVGLAADAVILGADFAECPAGCTFDPTMIAA